MSMIQSKVFTFKDCMGRVYVVMKIAQNLELFNSDKKPANISWLKMSRLFVKNRISKNAL